MTSFQNIKLQNTNFQISYVVRVPKPKRMQYCQNEICATKMDIFLSEKLSSGDHQYMYLF